MESIIEQFEQLDTIKIQQSEMAAKHSSLISKTEQKVKSWASICNASVITAPSPNLDKIVQGKIEEERVRCARELNLQVRCLPPTFDPFSARRSFLTDQLALSDIALDKCWIGYGNTLFIRFHNSSHRLRALRAKRNLFSLPSKIFLDEVLTKAQVAELKYACGIVAEARRARKWAIIRNLKAVVRDSPPSDWEVRQAKTK